MTFLQNIVDALPRILGSDERLASFAHDVGQALRTTDDEVLRQVRNLLATAVVEDEHRAGLVSGVLEMIDGYRSAVSSGQREDEALAELHQGLLRDVVAELAQRSSTTSKLAKALGKSMPEISRVLGRLRKLDLVDSTRDPLNGKVHPHRLSLQGRVLAERAGLISQIEAGRSANLRALTARPIEQIQFPSAGHRTLYGVALHVVADLMTRPWTAGDRVTADAMMGILAWQRGAVQARARAERHVAWTLVDSALRIVDGEALAHPDPRFEDSFRALLTDLPGGSTLRLLWAIAAAKLRTPSLRGEFAACADGVLGGFDLPVAWFWRREVSQGTSPTTFLKNCEDARPSLASGLPDELERNLAMAKDHTCYTWKVNLVWAPFEAGLDAAARRLYGAAEGRALVDQATAKPPTVQEIAADRELVSAADSFLGWMKAHPPKQLATAANDRILQEYVHHANRIVRCAGSPASVKPEELFAAPSWEPALLSNEALLVQMSTLREGPGVTCLRVAESRFQ
ncbi:MAG TPA: hypothetical protein VGD37_15285 [Kofleriaceae bacterium]